MTPPPWDFAGAPASEPDPEAVMLDGQPLLLWPGPLLRPWWEWLLPRAAFLTVFLYSSNVLIWGSATCEDKQPVTKGRTGRTVQTQPQRGRDTEGTWCRIQVKRQVPSCRASLLLTMLPLTRVTSARPMTSTVEAADLGCCQCCSLCQPLRCRPQRLRLCCTNLRFHLLNLSRHETFIRRGRSHSCSCCCAPGRASACCNADCQRLLGCASCGMGC